MDSIAIDVQSQASTVARAAATTQTACTTTICIGGRTLEELVRALMKLEVAQIRLDGLLREAVLECEHPSAEALSEHLRAFLWDVHPKRAGETTLRLTR